MNPATSAPVDFEMHAGFALFRASGHVRLDQAVAIVDAALASAHTQGIRKLLVDVEGFTGFASPGLGERYFFVRQWAKTTRGEVRVVVVTRPELIDPEKFGVKVAANLGFTCEVFPTRSEAETWLLSAP